MITVILTGPSGREMRLDTPDPALIGEWLHAIFRDYQASGRGIPVHFAIRIND